VHLVGFIIRIYHDARSAERQIRKKKCRLLTKNKQLIVQSAVKELGNIS
jgi:hypothetical protein